MESNPSNNTPDTAATQAIAERLNEEAQRASEAVLLHDGRRSGKAEAQPAEAPAAAVKDGETKGRKPKSERKPPAEAPPAEAPPADAPATPSAPACPEPCPRCVLEEGYIGAVFDLPGRAGPHVVEMAEDISGRAVMLSIEGDTDVKSSRINGRRITVTLRDCRDERVRLHVVALPVRRGS